MKAIEILITLIIFSVALIVYYSMFGSVVTSITGAVTNWSNISGTNIGWLPGILVIMAALMPLFALVLTLWVELHIQD
jgi:hypothetical protein